MPGETESEPTPRGPYAATNSIHVEDLKDSQYQAFKEFKENISDVVSPDYSDECIIKWLRSNNYNLSKAEALFRGTVRVRELYGFDTILENYVKPEVSRKYEATACLGIAKNGSPIRYSHVGKADFLGFLLSQNIYDICLYCTHMTEYDIDLMKMENRRSGRRVCELTYILDMEDFSLQALISRPLIETGLDLLRVVNEHYPEIWGNIFMVNAPGYFDKFFNVFKPFMRLNMLQRIRVASKDSTPALLLKYIDEDVLPAFLGGKRTDSTGDRNCAEFIPQGGAIPESYHLRNVVKPLRGTDPGVTEVCVCARSFYNHPVVVSEGGSRIQVEFRTEDGSIGFKMLYRKFEGDPSVDLPACDENLDENDPRSNVTYVSPCMRFQAHTTPVDRHKVRVPWPGIYIFRFDNTHSWFKSKKLFFRFQVLEDS